MDDFVYRYKYTDEPVEWTGREGMYVLRDGAWRKAETLEEVERAGADYARFIAEEEVYRDHA